MSGETSKENETMNAKRTTSRRRRIAFAAVAAAALAAWLMPATQAVAAPAPAWSIAVSSMPTNFAPGAAGTIQYGPNYYVLATNVGGAPTTGPYTISDTLPAGLTPASGADGYPGRSPSNQLSCQTTGQTVSCTGEVPIGPSETVTARIPVDVEAGAEGDLLDEARIEGGGGAPVTTTTTTTISLLEAPFDFLASEDGHRGVATDADGTTATQAGSHPYQLTVGMGFPTFRPGTIRAGGGGVKDIYVDMPPGVVLNPNATPVRCTEAQFETNACPLASQVGTIVVPLYLVNVVTENTPIYNMVPPPGAPAEFAFSASVEIYVHIVGRLRSGGDYGLSGDVNDIIAKVPIMGSRPTFWGNPSDPSHDAQRGSCLLSAAADTCPTEPSDEAFVTMPSDCRGPITTVEHADAWKEIGNFKETSYESADAAGTPVGITGCNQLEFKPTIEAKPTTNLADSPSGLDFNLHQPQNNDFEGRSTANLKNTTVTLPEGMTVNPSSADGLGACTEAQLDLHGKDPANCPGPSKLGSVEVKTPLLKEPLPGAVYLAKPYENPFGSLLALYITVDDPMTGVVVKLVGKVTTDPNTGRLTTTVTESPELPVEDFELHFFGGPRGALRTPPTCNTYTTQANLTPWSTPEGADAPAEDSFAIQAAPGGGNCPTSAAGAPNAPSFTAGTISPQAGAYTPFVLRVTRADATQPLAKIDATLPPGLAGKLAGIPYCSEAQIAAAKAREVPNQGAAELASPSCPAASEVGTVDVAAGAGITPLHVTGRAYLAGPYKGAPLSVVIITPAVAGPFDLGAVAVRTALQVNPETAQIHAVSDPLPTILQGIPLDVRSVSLQMARPTFTLNPTSCDPMAITASATSVLGQSAALSSPFQVGGCSSLAFKPKLSLRLKGATRRAGHPALTATARFTPGQANTKRVSVTLPPTEFLDQGHIKTICTRVQFAASQCPAASVYGFARATSPLLDKPLEGPVYLRSSSHPLPDLVVALHGQVDVVLAGRVDTVKRSLRTTFEAAPDAPVTKFVLEMQGGKKGLLVNSANLCKLKGAATRATVKMEGQNGKVHDTSPVVKNDCGAKAKKKAKKGAGNKAHR